LLADAEGTHPDRHQKRCHGGDAEIA